MVGLQIRNRLREGFSRFTEDFSDIDTIISLVKNNTEITATTTTDHGLNTNDYTTIKGVKRKVNIISIVDNGTTATITCQDLHYQFIETNPTITIEGCNISGYNGIKDVVIYQTTKEIVIKSQNLGSANTGYLLVDDNVFFGGYKKITKISNTSFKYNVANTIANQTAGGSAKYNKNSRIELFGSVDRLEKFLLTNENKKYLGIVVGSEAVEKSGAGITTDSYSVSEEFYFKTLLDFSIYIAIPTQDSAYAGIESDLARSYIKPILKSIANYSFISNLSQVSYQPCIYDGNSTEEYDGAFYIHRFDFKIIGEISNSDGVDHFEEAVPLQEIDFATNNWQSNVNY